MDSYLIQISTASKKHIHTDDTYAYGLILLEKGAYVIRVRICHSDFKMLEKLKDLRLIATQLFREIANLYLNSELALKDSTEKMVEQHSLISAKEKVSYYVGEPSSELPSNYSVGSYLKGRLSLQTDETYRSIEYSSFDIIYLLAAPESKDANSRLEIEADKCDEENDLKSEIRDIEISYLTKETDSKKAAAMFEKLSSEFPTFLPIYSAEIERLSKLKDYLNLKEMVEKLLEISEIEKVEKYFGVNSNFNEENLLKKAIMGMKKNAIENGLFLQANLALDLFLKSTKKDIPKAFRNSFDPRKENEIIKDVDKMENNPLNENEKAEVEKPKKMTETFSWASVLKKEDFNKMSKMSKETEKTDDKKLELSSRDAKSGRLILTEKNITAGTL
uniref:Tripeptidyl peptidase II Ig-like domain-containing protein n=1 Tax=Panagrolaimus davidi TaxID=227884 RepID=A0A914QNE0_9BILA